MKHHAYITLVGRCWEQRAEQLSVVYAMHGAQGRGLLVCGTTRDDLSGFPSFAAPRAETTTLGCCHALSHDWLLLPALLVVCFTLFFMGLL